MPSSPGIPDWFSALFVIVVLIAIGTAVWRVTTARRIARDAGLDPDTAGRIALLGNDGLDATYLASVISNHQPQHHQPQQHQPPGPTAEERLRQLQTLRDQGLVSEDEYTTRRQHILDSI